MIESPLPSFLTKAVFMNHIDLRTSYIETLNACFKSIYLYTFTRVTHNITCENIFLKFSKDGQLQQRVNTHSITVSLIRLPILEKTQFWFIFIHVKSMDVVNELKSIQLRIAVVKEINVRPRT